MKKLISLVSALCICGLGVGLVSACQEIPSVYLGGEEAAHTHSYTSEVTTAATCTEDGVMTYTCTCGDSYTESIPATGHTWGDWSADIVDGVDQGTHTHICSVCETPETQAHEWGTWTKVATEGDGTQYEKVCEACGAVATASTVSDIIGDLDEGETFSIEVDNATDLSTALVDGATIVLAPEADEENVPTLELSETISVSEGVSATVVVSEGTALTCDSSSFNPPGSALISVGGEGAGGASLTLVLEEGATVSGDATSESGNGQGHGGLLDVKEGGTLVVDGDGEVTQEHSSAAVLRVEKGGTCVINGGCYSVTDCQNYTIINDGDLTINGGTVFTLNSGSSLVLNGDDNTWYHDVEKHEAPSLTINGGEFLGGKHVIKNCLDGVLTIYDGYFAGYHDEEGNTESVGETTDLIDNEEATTIIYGGQFGEPNSESNNYKRLITIKGGTTDVTDPYTEYPSIVTIEGGSFVAGSEASGETTTLGLFDFGDSSKQETASTLDQLHIADSVYAELFPNELSGSEAFKVSETISATGYVVLIGASVSEVTTDQG